MANLYVKHTGSNTAPYDTWAKAATTLATAAGACAAGDNIYVSSTHSESTAGAITYNWPGTVTSPNYVVCVNDGAAPPTAVATGGTITTTGNSTITLASTGDYVYIEGLTFVSGSAASGTASIQVQGAINTTKNCTFNVSTTGTGSRIVFSALWGRHTNLSIKFGAAGQGINTGADSNGVVTGGSLLSGGTSPTALVVAFGGGSLLIEDFDLSNASSSINIASAVGDSARFVMRNSKLPASWSGSLHSGTPGIGAKYEMFNCDSGDTNYRYRCAGQFGTIQEETTLVRTSGASDGTTTFSWKIVTNANAENPTLTVDTPERVRWNDTTSAITLTVEILRDSATNLKDDEVWIEASYLGTSGVPLGTFVSDTKADILATAADQTASSATWTTTGMSNPNKQKLSVTFTPQEKGYIHYKVRAAKASATIYVDPMATVT